MNGINLSFFQNAATNTGQYFSEKSKEAWNSFESKATASYGWLKDKVIKPGVIPGIGITAATALMHWHPGCCQTVFFASVAFPKQSQGICNRITGIWNKSRWYERLALLYIAFLNRKNIAPILLGAYASMRLANHLSYELWNTKAKIKAQKGDPFGQVLSRGYDRLVAEPKTENDPTADTQLSFADRMAWRSERVRRSARGPLMWLRTQFRDTRAWLSKGFQYLFAGAMIRVNPPLSALVLAGTLPFKKQVKPVIERISDLWVKNNVLWRLYFVANAGLTVQVSPIFLGAFAAARFGLHLADRLGEDKKYSNKVITV